MCDYSLMHVKSRPAAVGDKLVTKSFGGSSGFADVKDCSTVVCVLPGTELAFDEKIKIGGMLLNKKTEHKTAIFRQVNKDNALVHHDTLEFPDGETSLLTHLVSEQTATVLQLPAQPKTEKEVEDQRRVEVVA